MTTWRQYRPRPRQGNSSGLRTAEPLRRRKRDGRAGVRRCARPRSTENTVLDSTEDAFGPDGRRHRCPCEKAAFTLPKARLGFCSHADAFLGIAKHADSHRGYAGQAEQPVRLLGGEPLLFSFGAPRSFSGAKGTRKRRQPTGRANPEPIRAMREAGPDRTILIRSCSFTTCRPSVRLPPRIS